MAYFKYFPSIQYGDSGLVKDITRRVKLSTLEAINDTNIFNDYTVKNQTRADVLANQYYDTPEADWLIYFANDVIDPLSDMFVADELLEAMIVAKYGSIERAQRRTAYFKNNWSEDDSILSVAAFGSLPVSVRQFYDIETDYNGSVIGFARKNSDITKMTNTIVRFNAIVDAVEGDEVRIYASANQIGTAEVKAVSPTLLVACHVIEQFVGATSVVINGIQYPATVASFTYSISNTEAPYFSRVSIYDDLVQRNIEKQRINLVSSDVQQILQDRLITLIGSS
jgi:hypothetical protein